MMVQKDYTKAWQITFKYRIRHKIEKYVESYDFDKSFRCDDVKYVKTACPMIYLIKMTYIATQINKATSEILDRISILLNIKNNIHTL